MILTSNYTFYTFTIIENGIGFSVLIKMGIINNTLYFTFNGMDSPLTKEKINEISQKYGYYYDFHTYRSSQTHIYSYSVGNVKYERIGILKQVIRDKKINEICEIY